MAIDFTNIDNANISHLHWTRKDHQVLAWDRHTNVTALKRSLRFKLSPIDNLISNRKTDINNRLKPVQIHIAHIMKRKLNTELTIMLIIENNLILMLLNEFCTYIAHEGLVSIIFINYFIQHWTGLDIIIYY